VKPNADKPEAKPEAKDDLKSLPMQELQKKLASTPDGLSQAEAQKRLTQYGPNEIEEKKINPFLKFLTYFWGPIPWMIEVAVILSGVVRHWPDFFIIILLLVANAVVRQTFASLVAESFYQIRGSAIGNVAIMLRMLGALQTIASLTASPSRRRTLLELVEWIAELAERTIESPHDWARYKSRLVRVRQALEKELVLFEEAQSYKSHHLNPLVLTTRTK
jgi:magnesium-transporting ATPase (P-type)